MTGVVSSIADDLVLGSLSLAIGGLATLLAFIAGSASTAILVNWARRQKLHSEFALSLALEAILLLLFGLLGGNLNVLIEVFMPTTVLVLSYIMGLQNAVVTKISKAEIRTTHVTGVVTDLGIEVGRLIYWNRMARDDVDSFVRADRDKLKIHATILGLFFCGGLIGGLAFKSIGFAATVPIAAVLLFVSLPPLIQDFLPATARTRD